MSQSWLASLPLYSCPTCNKQTIFKDGCVDCDVLESAKQDLQDLKAEFEQNAKDIRDLTSRQARIKLELSNVEAIINKR